MAHDFDNLGSVWKVEVLQRCGDYTVGKLQVGSKTLLCRGRRVVAPWV